MPGRCCGAELGRWCVVVSAADQQRKATLFTHLFPKPLSTLTKRALEGQIKVAEAFVERLAKSDAHAALRCASCTQCRPRVKEEWVVPSDSQRHSSQHLRLHKVVELARHSGCQSWVIQQHPGFDISLLRRLGKVGRG